MFEVGQRIVLPGDSELVVVGSVNQTAAGWELFVEISPGHYRRVTVSNADAPRVEVWGEDGTADPSVVLAGFWAEWMRAATVESKATVRASAPLRPYDHQTTAVYGAMLPQPRLRFLLADEPGTGKTIMAGMYLREMQRLGFVRRALVIAPAHLVKKWCADFDRFFGGGLKRIRAGTVYEGALGIEHDLWITSLDLASVNPRVQEAIRPDLAGWDAVVIDEAHRMTLSAQAYYQLGLLMSRAPRVLLMTATPHRGKESLFRGLMHLVDPDVFPAVDEHDQPGRQLKPGPLHFLRRMKEDLYDYDGVTRLFRGRRARNMPVALNSVEQAYYNQALELVDRYFPPSAAGLARMVYGKRAASSLYALRETLQRRHEKMGGDSPVNVAMAVDPEGEDEAERELAQVVVEQSLAAKAERRDLREVIHRLDGLLSDSDMAVSKWPRVLTECLVANGILPGGSLQAVVFTEYADTADWLVRRFRSCGYSAERYSGRDSDSDRELIRNRFEERKFQIIVSTDAGNEGIDLQSAHVLVNWDIPWSLVRLEQRMGRIHRVGQTRDVELYNLFATGTREGDVLEVLLANFVVAATRLDGRMFDSLSLVAEMVDLDFKSTLAQTYDSPERAAAALATARALTAARLEQAARRAAEEEDSLRSAVDRTQAIASLQEETIEQINPRIVEAFLRRLLEARVLSVEPSAAGAGVFTISAGSLAALPDQFGSSGKALVATSGNALDEARLAGADVSEAVPLGPGDPPFRWLVFAGAGATRSSLLRGGRLLDRTSVTDYALFAFEVEIQEFGGKRQTSWPFLIRADSAGARRVRWESLANLEPGTQEVSPLHPGRAADAEAAAIDVASAERSRRANMLSEWMQRAVDDLEKLPSALSSHIEEQSARVAARSRTRAAVDRRLAELRHMTMVEVGSPRRIGWATVSAAGTPLDPTEADSEEIAMVHVANTLRAAGWAVADVHREGRGYDLLARKGRDQRSIEVKGVWDSASAAGIRMTGNEILIARQLAREYWLYVVDHCRDGQGRIFSAYCNPAERFSELMKDVTVIVVPGSALRQARGEASPT